MVRPYIPGDITDPQLRHESYKNLCEQYSEKITKQENDKLIAKSQLGVNFKPIDSNFVPLADEYSNFQIAKKLFNDNLEHKPLVDTVLDDNYRKLQMQKHRNPGIGLNGLDKPIVTGIGYRECSAKGPTHCTKLKVYRPKTTSIVNKKQTENFYEKHGFLPRFIRQNHVTPIELAICWDIVPLDPKDEPKPPIHIDGSNGCKAPAVFTLVYSPVPPQTNEPVRENTKANFQVLDQQDLQDPNENGCQIGENIFRENPCDCSFDCICRINKKFKNMSIKNQNQKSRYFLQPCELKQIANYSEISPKSEYKMAFKAGKLSNGHSSLQKVKVIKVPKQREPYKKKNYRIESLAPPFSVWSNKTRRFDYPEHSRLATIYQLSYKSFLPIKKMAMTKIKR